MRRVVNATADPGTAWEDPQTPTFLFVSRLAPRKQPTVFVEAAIALLREGSEARFVVAGPDQGELESRAPLIDASGFQDRFDLPGELTEPQVLEALAHATAVVLPARHEPYPMVIIEAAAVGTPIILTSECGLAAALAEGGCGDCRRAHGRGIPGSHGRSGGRPGSAATAECAGPRAALAPMVCRIPRGASPGLYAEAIDAGRK